MAQLKFGSAGVTATEIDLTGPVVVQPVGVPAGIIGTSLKGPAFVPVTVGALSDFYAKFGLTDGKKFGPLAVTEWLRNAGAVTYLRVLGAGDCKTRNIDGSVNNGGFTVGNQQPQLSDGNIVGNPYANSGTLGSPLGRTFFLGAFMSESLGSFVFSSASIQGAGSTTPGLNTALSMIRGVIMAPSGVIIRLSSSAEGTNSAPSSTAVATDATANGKQVGAVVLLDGTTAKQDFVLLLNGHQGLDPKYPNVITASFDMTSQNYFANVLNKDPYSAQQAGHLLYAHWDIHPCTAVVTGAGLVLSQSGAGAATAACSGKESAAFITTGSLARNVGSSIVPNYEAFTDRFSQAQSPWIISQKFGGSPVNLFRLHSLDSGAGISTMYKISIENLTPSTDLTNKYGTFDVVIRSWSDSDLAQLPLESFRGVCLDPTSDRYIAKQIGDANVFFDFDRAEQAQKVVVQGNYALRSNLVRVEVDSGVDNATTDPTALPVGFRGIDHLVTSGSAPLASYLGSQLGDASYLLRSTTPPLPMRMNLTIGSGQKVQVESRFYWGTQFEHVTSLSSLNGSSLANLSLKSFARYFPEFSVTNQNFAVGSNTGAVDTAANGIIDADRFCSNLFTLENVLVVVDPSTTVADPTAWASAVYMRGSATSAPNTSTLRLFNVSDLTQPNRRFAKFTLIMQGGFDGVNIFDTDAVAIDNFAVTADMNFAARGRDQGPNVRSYIKALQIMQNVVNTDIQLLAIPGIRHPMVTNAAADAVKDRFDALYIMDIEQYDNSNNEVFLDSQQPSVQLTANNFSSRAVDNNFAAAYFPDVVITDPNTSSNLFVPPSVVVLGALALNDSIGHPWFAPAGTTRGALSTTQEARVALSKQNMDTLYDVSINPLVAFPGNAQGGVNPKGGVLVWGQKTLQASASALDRVNVRRLMIELRRQVRDISQTIIFEPNRAATLARFTAAVTPRLARIQAQAGLQQFKVVIDSSTTSQQDIENNTIRGKILVYPTKSIEFVSLDFVVTNNISSANPLGTRR